MVGITRIIIECCCPNPNGDASQISLNRSRSYDPALHIGVCAEWPLFSSSSEDKNSPYFRLHTHIYFGGEVPTGSDNRIIELEFVPGMNYVGDLFFMGHNSPMKFNEANRHIDIGLKQNEHFFGSSLIDKENTLSSVILKNLVVHIPHDQQSFVYETVTIPIKKNSPMLEQ